ncbi:MAG: hypothetical protein H7202_04695 [Pedobacter sp.]|nr:hypothetical protein [Pedobacter sp.]
MLSIRIKDIKQKVHTFKGPSNWEEITPKQLRTWGKVCLMRAKVDDAMKAISFIFFNIKREIFEQLDEGQHHQIHYKIGFLRKNDCYFWIIPSFWFMLRKYYGPANRLSNLTINEYRLTDLYYQLYISTNDPNFLNLLIATLYRPKRKKASHNDLREDYQEIIAVKRAKLFKWLPGSLKYAILFNYEGCRFYIHGHPKFSKLFKKGSAGNKKELYDYDVMIQTVAGGAFGNYKETGAINLYTFLEHVVRQIEEVEKLKS